jgi:hypothetical protein
MKQQEQEYQDIKRWLKGEKPPAQGRLWHRMARKVVPRVIRKPLEEACGVTTGDVLGLLASGLAIGGPLLAGALVIVSSDWTLTLFEVTGQQLPNTPLGEMAKTMRVFTQSVAYVVGGIAVALSGMRILFGGR